MHIDRLANLLGAAALAVTDEMVNDAVGSSQLNTSQATALTVLRGESGLSITELSKRLGLHQSACTRVVNSLETTGLVERRHSFGKWIVVHLTGQGIRVAEQILKTRGQSLAGVLEHLDDQTRVALADGLEKLLTGLYDQIRSSDRICRMCDRPSCTPEGSVCPVGAAERERERTDPSVGTVESE